MNKVASLALSILFFFTAACGAARVHDAAPPFTAPEQPDAITPLPPLPPAPAAPEPPAALEPLVEHAQPMTAQEAERYVLALLDRDRAANGMPPLRWDETAARAARRHAADLLAHGVTCHVGTDGSVPEQRYTEAGGRAMAWENVACFADGEARVPDPGARFFADNLGEIERAMMNEAPPRDGHRRNILGARHNAVGVGLAATRSSHYACMVQELVDDHAAYADLPATLSAGSVVEVSGALRPPLRVLAVGVSRSAPQRQRSADELRPTRKYPIPSPQVVFQPPGFGTPIVLETDSEQRAFRVRVPIGAGGERGIYGISVWASFPGAKDPALVSLRTIDVH